MTPSDDEAMVWYTPPRSKRVATVVLGVVFAGMGAASVLDMLFGGPSIQATIPGAIPGAILLGLFWLCMIFGLAWASSVRVGLGRSRLVYRSLFGSTTIPFGDIVTISRFRRRGTQMLRIWTVEEWMTLSTLFLAIDDLNTIGRSLVASCPWAIVKGRERLCSD